MNNSNQANSFNFESYLMEKRSKRTTCWIMFGMGLFLWPFIIVWIILEIKFSNWNDLMLFQMNNNSNNFNNSNTNNTQNADFKEVSDSELK